MPPSFAKTTDRGATAFTLSTIESANSVGGAGAHHCLFTDDGNDITISFRDVTDDKIRVARSANGGTSWNTTSVLEASAVGGVHFAMYGVTEDVLIFTYDNPGNALKYARTTDKGNTWFTATIESGNITSPKSIGGF